jgi:hypothetical protein
MGRSHFAMGSGSRGCRQEADSRRIWLPDEGWVGFRGSEAKALRNNNYSFFGQTIPLLIRPLINGGLKNRHWTPDFQKRKESDCGIVHPSYYNDRGNYTT